MKGCRMSNTDGNPSCGAGVAKEADGSGRSVGKFGIGGKSLADCPLRARGTGATINGTGLPATPLQLRFARFSQVIGLSVCQRCAARGVLSERLSYINQPGQLSYSPPAPPTDVDSTGTSWTDAGQFSSCLAWTGSHDSIGSIPSSLEQELDPEDI